MAVSLQTNQFNIIDFLIMINNFVISIAKYILDLFGKVGLLLLVIILLPLLFLYTLFLVFIINFFIKIISQTDYTSLNYDELIKTQKDFRNILKNKKVYTKPKKFILYKKINQFYTEVEKADNIISKQIEKEYNKYFTSEESRNEYEKVINGLASW